MWYALCSLAAVYVYANSALRFGLAIYVQLGSVAQFAGSDAPISGASSVPTLALLLYSDF
jgi:hypothetical protein